jgi:hypothetical protein
MTWAELRKPGPWLTGNTKWQEVECIIFFFRNGFILRKTYNDIGYSRKQTSFESLTQRLDNVNTKELLKLGTKLMMSNLLKRDWAWLLDPKRKPRNKRGCGGGALGKHRIIFSKAIVNQAIHKYGLNKVCFKLRVDMKVITFWRDYEV